MAMHERDYGRNTDESVNMDYCKYCYPDGSFGKDETMEEMIESCIPFYAQEFGSVEAAREHLARLYPTLKRWKKKCTC